MFHQFVGPQKNPNTRWAPSPGVHRVIRRGPPPFYPGSPPQKRAPPGPTTKSNGPAPKTPEGPPLAPKKKREGRKNLAPFSGPQGQNLGIPVLDPQAFSGGQEEPPEGTRAGECTLLMPWKKKLKKVPKVQSFC